MTKTKLITSFYTDVSGFPFYGHKEITRHERYLHSLRTLNNIEEEIICYCNSTQLELLQKWCSKFELENVKLKVSNLDDYPKAKQMAKIKEETADFNFYHEIDWNKIYLLEKEYDEDYEYIYWIDVGISHRGLFLLKYNPHAELITGFSKDWENYSFTRLFNSDLFPKINNWVKDKLINLSHTRLGPRVEMINQIYDSYHQFESNTIGGILGGHISKLKWLIKEFKNAGDVCLEQNYILNHEKIISYLALEKPSMFSTYLFDTWYHDDYWKATNNFDREFIIGKTHFVHFFQQELGIDPLEMDDLFDKVLHYYGKKKKDLSIINIGALDGYQFDELSGYVDMYDYNIIYVEPIPYYYSKLIDNTKNHKKRKYENAAISTYNGKITMTIIPPHIVEAGLVHPAFAGMSAIDPSKNGMGSEADKEVVDQYGEEIEVDCLTFESFLKKHKITSFDVLSMDTEGHDYEIFKQIDFRKFRPKLIRLEYMNLTDQEKIHVVEELSQNNYVLERKNQQDLDAIPKEIYDLLYEHYMAEVGIVKDKIPNRKPQVKISNSNKSESITLVTGLWNIKRESLSEGWSRSFDHYLNSLKALLQVPYNLIVFGDEDIDELSDILNNSEKILYVRREKEWFRNEFYELIQSIRSEESWLNQVGWLKESCQAKLEMYNPLVMSKTFLLNDARIIDPFNSTHLFWIDAGISNTVDLRYFSEHRVLDKLENTRKLSFVAFPYETNSEIHGFEYESMREYSKADVDKVCRGGFFGGPKDLIANFNSQYYSLMSTTLHQGLMGTEESLFTILTYRFPAMFQYYEIHENGLLNAFFEDLKNDDHKALCYTVTTKQVKEISDVKVALYILTFNSPNQLEALIKSMIQYDNDFIDRPEIYLLDNSSDSSTFKGYSKICKTYNVEHIKKDNLGICGGRQFIAEHADEHDFDYYLFFEDDMFLSQSKNEICDNGFAKYTEGLYLKALSIIHENDLDFLKLSFTEFYGNNSTQWAWYNVPQNVREEIWPDNSKLPEQGLASDPPRTVIKEIISKDGLSFAKGEIYYCNWPQIVSRNGNRKMFLTEKWDRPHEQTWMSYIFQETLKSRINPGLLMLSPIEHERFDHYQAALRKES